MTELSVFTLLVHLTALAACTGQIEPVATGERSATDEVRDASTRDASKGGDARASTAKVDAARAEGDIVDPDLVDGGGTIEIPEPPVVMPDEDSGSAGDPMPDAAVAEPSDAGALVDAAAPAPQACANGQPLAKGLKLRELALYQTVKVSLYKGGAWVSDRAAPVVVGKKALARVFVDTQSGYSAHAVRGVLTLTGSKGTNRLESQRTITASSTDADDASTFSFALEPAMIEGDTQLSVALEELDCAATSGVASDVRLPATGTRALEAEAIGKLKVIVLPISIGDRVPNMGAAELAKIRESLLAYYPVADVDVSVRATPYQGPSTISGADSTAWSNLLNSVLRERSNDRAPADTYYFGLMQPTATFAQFCARGCILGIAPQTTRVAPSSQGGLGAYFADQQSLETIVHELGHAHGRGHAPCVKGGSIQGVDGAFPDTSGGIVDWGWDSRTSKLISPSTYKDVMGYCSPNWISPYTYAAIAARSQAVNSLAYVSAAATETVWTNVLLYADGRARWGGAQETWMPGGELETATVLDSAGRVLETITITRLVLSHSDDVIVYLPAPASSWAQLQLRDRVLDLRTVLSAL